MTDEPLNTVFVSSVQFTSSEQQIRLSGERQLVRLKAQRLFGIEKRKETLAKFLFVECTTQQPVVMDFSSSFLFQAFPDIFPKNYKTELSLTSLIFYKINLIKPYLPTLKGMAGYEKVFITSCNNKIWSARVNALQPP